MLEIHVHYPDLSDKALNSHLYPYFTDKETEVQQGEFLGKYPPVLQKVRVESEVKAGSLSTIPTERGFISPSVYTPATTSLVCSLQQN